MCHKMCHDEVLAEAVSTIEMPSRHDRNKTSLPNRSVILLTYPSALTAIQFSSFVFHTKPSFITHLRVPTAPRFPSRTHIINATTRRNARSPYNPLRSPWRNGSALDFYACVRHDGIQRLRVRAPPEMLLLLFANLLFFFYLVCRGGGKGTCPSKQCRDWESDIPVGERTLRRM